MNCVRITGNHGEIWDRLTILIFTGLLWLPTLDYSLKLDHAIAPMENRMMAKWPRFGGLGQSRDFIAGIENYFNDHFGWRARLVCWNNHWKEQLFHDPVNNRLVLIGRNGWLFHSGEQMIQHWAGMGVLSERELGNWCRLLEMRRDWLRARGAKYLFVVPPDKHTVYPEYLPAWLEAVPQPSKVQQLVTYMKAPSTVEVLDLSQALIEAKKIRVAYLQTDTHWNAFGGFVAYRALVQAMACQLPALEPLPLEAYDWKTVPSAGLELARRLGITESFSESYFVKPIPIAPLADVEILRDPVRLPNKSSQEPLFRRNTNAPGKAMVFRDSFSGSWYSHLGQHFNEVLYIWQYDWDRPLIEREQPDVVIDEMLQRFFNISDPIDLARKDQLSEAQAAEGIALRRPGRDRD